MKAPDKIYRTTTYLDNDKGKTLWKEAPAKGAENIEYTRTDTFIDKAVNFFIPYIRDNSGGYERAAVIEDFKNYMKSE